jgi:glycine C-acetyltransferase
LLLQGKLEKWYLKWRIEVELIMRDPVGFLKEEYNNLVKNDLNWKIYVLDSPSGPHVKINDQDKIMLCSNNYLDLANHPRLKKAAKKAVDEYGAGSGSVRSIAGTMKIHVELEEEISRFKEREASLYYQTGFSVNSGLIPQLVDNGDVVISDELNHGSIIDGVRLSKADKLVYKHRDVSDLERLVREADKKYRRILVITDGVFSMDGDIAPVKEIAKITDTYGAMFYVDDAHGDGVLGMGKGIGKHYNIEKYIHVELGTFSKAFGVVGGMISGSQELINFAYNKSRTWLLSGSAPPAVAGACIEALKVVQEEPQRVNKLWENAEYFRKEIQAMGYNTGNSMTPIIPVIVGESSKAKELSEGLIKEGVFALPIVYPMVAKNLARIRTIMNSGHTKEDLNTVLRTFEVVGKRLKII